jgi:pimeloyl-ACP methyl ester carboxylesterase
LEELGGRQYRKTAPFVHIGDGHQLYIRDWGEGAPVVLLSGWAMDSRGWGDTMVRLNASGLRTIAYDRRGHGRSTDPGRYDYDVLADDLAAVLDALALEKAVLVGHSGSGGEIIRYLTRHGSGRIKHVVLVGATGPRMLAAKDNPLGIPSTMVEPIIQRLVEDLPGWIAENIKPFAPSARMEILNWLCTMPLDTSRRALIDFQRAILTTDFTEEAKAIAVPVTLIHGDADLSAPLEWTARRYMELIPQAQLSLYADGAHGLMITHAARLATDITRASRSAVSA